MLPLKRDVSPETLLWLRKAIAVNLILSYWLQSAFAAE